MPFTVTGVRCPGCMDGLSLEKWARILLHFGSPHVKDVVFYSVVSERRDTALGSPFRPRPRMRTWAIVL